MDFAKTLNYVKLNGGFHTWGYPNMDDLPMESPLKVDDLGVAPFMENPHIVKPFLLNLATLGAPSYTVF